jgi:formate dehydrogenase beta subunit
MPGQSGTQASLARRPRTGPRGRVASETALAAVRAAVGDAPLRRDLLIEHLHKLHGRHGGLREGHLVALAELMRLAPVEVFEVASFYHHFDILPDDAPEPPRDTIRVCDGLPCAMAGGGALLAALHANPPPGTRVVAAPCMGACHEGPACITDGRLFDRVTPGTFAQGIPLPPPAPPVPLPTRLEHWPLLHAARDGSLGRDAMLAALETAGLRGLGGAGFPVARKWRSVRRSPDRAISW